MALLGSLVRFLFRWAFSWTGLCIFLVVTAFKRLKKFVDTLPTAVAVNFLRYISTTDPEPLRSKDWLSFYMLPPWVQTICRVRPLRKVLKVLAKTLQRSTYQILLTRTIFFDMHLQRLLTQCDREEEDNNDDPKASEPFAQFAIMGAGFDTRAYRFKQLLIDHETIPIEIDLPQMQQIKRQRLLEAAKTLSKEPAHRQLDSSHVRFVPTDFNLGELQKLLIDEGFQSHRKSIFLIEGVLGYLPPAVTDSTLNLLHFLSGPGSYLMCTIRVSPAPLANFQRSDPAAYKALLTSPAGEKKLVELGLSPSMARKYRKMYERGEPWLSSVPDLGPDSVQKYFDQFHLKVVEQMVPRDVYQKYCHVSVDVADNENGREYEGSKFVVAMFRS